MIQRQIFTALDVPSAVSQPSTKCVQWSGDGQLIVTTKTAIYILTPDLGISFDSPSLLRSAAIKRNEQDIKDSMVELRWHKNLIEFDKGIQHLWPAVSQEWGALSLGSLDVSLRAVTISPSNLSPTAGCLLVAMNTNMELSLWMSTKNHLKQAWSKVQDITTTLEDLSPPRGDDISHERKTYIQTLQAQVISTAWSPQADFGLSPNPLVDGSMLALGNRAGSVILMRYDGEQNVHHIENIRVADGWITHLAWAPWKCPQPSQSESYLACGIHDGSIILIRVRQHLQRLVLSTPSGSEFEVKWSLDVLDVKASEADDKGITALEWVEGQNSMPTLLHAKPGQLRFFRPPVGEISILRLSTQKLSIGSSSLTPVVSVSNVAGSDSLIIGLFDGSFHVVQNVSDVPTLHRNDQTKQIENEQFVLSSTNLSHAARGIFNSVEDGSMQFTDVNRMNGATSFDSFGTMTWLHEACQPTHFNYKHDAKHNAMLVVAQLWVIPDRNENVLHFINNTLKRPMSALGHAPAHTLRPILLHLCQHQVFDVLTHQVLQILQETYHEDGIEYNLQKWTNPVNENTRRIIRRSLAIDLYGWDAFYSLRLRFALADFCWKMSSVDETKNKFGTIAQNLQKTILHRFLGTLVKHLTAAIDCLNEQEVPFLMRVVVQGILEGTPEDLASRANDLNQLIKIKFPSSSDIFNLSEPCPACRESIPLENLSNGVCPRGHVWVRCSITTFVLSTPLVRTCIGCSRKAFLPPSFKDAGQIGSLSRVPDAGQSWIVDELLEAARCCLYCGNRFIHIL